MMETTMKRLSCFILLALLFCISVMLPVTATSAPSNASGYIIVINPPVADFFASNRYGSAPFPVSFSSSPSTGDTLSYTWDFGDGSSSMERNPTHTYRTDGVYDVRLTVTNIYGSDTRVKQEYIDVGDAPQANFSAVPARGVAPLQVTFTDMSAQGPSAWDWNFGDGTSAQQQNPVHVYAAPGNYSVILTVSNHHGSDTLERPGYIVVSEPVVQVATAPVVPKPGGIAGLLREARGTTEKNLPTAGIIPQQFMALAAVITSLAVVAANLIISNIGSLAQVGSRFAKFLADLAGGHAVEKISDKEIEARGLTARKIERRFFGLSASEILTIEVAVIAIALAFLLADRAVLNLQMVIVYLAVGAVSVILHDFAHRMVMARHGHDTNIRFWGLGTVIMFVTAWLYGNAFAQPYWNLKEEAEGEASDHRETGLEMVAGPCVSIVLTVLSLALMTAGGIWATAGAIGFSINLITSVYSMMPIETMDGLAVWRWNRWVFIVLFVPLFAFYLYTYIIV